MPKDPLPLVLEDVSQFARSLRQQVPGAVSHQTMLNHVARAAGYRNYQHLSASLRAAPPDQTVPDTARLRRAARWFDHAGRFTGWPARRDLRLLCLWPIWAQLDPAGRWTEREVSATIDTLCTFRDAAGIRREMVCEGLLTRNRDGSVYTRLTPTPDATARALIRAVLP